MLHVSWVVREQLARRVFGTSKTRRVVQDEAIYSVPVPVRPFVMTLPQSLTVLVLARVHRRLIEVKKRIAQRDTCFWSTESEVAIDDRPSRPRPEARTAAVDSRDPGPGRDLGGTSTSEPLLPPTIGFDTDCRKGI